MIFFFEKVKASRNQHQNLKLGVGCTFVKSYLRDGCEGPISGSGLSNGYLDSPGWIHFEINALYRPVLFGSVGQIEPVLF